MAIALQPGCFVNLCASVSTAPIRGEEGHWGPRPSRKCEPGQLEHRKTQCSAALSRCKEKWCRCSLVLVLHRLWKSFQAPPLSQILGLPPVYLSWCLRTTKTWILASKWYFEISTSKCWAMTLHAAVSLGVPFYVISTHQSSELIQGIAAQSQSAFRLGICSSFIIHELV